MLLAERPQLPPTNGVDDQLECLGVLPSTGVVQVEPGERIAPSVKNGDKLARGNEFINLWLMEQPGNAQPTASSFYHHELVVADDPT